MSGTGGQSGGNESRVTSCLTCFRNEDKALCGERRDMLDGYKEEACCSWVSRIRTIGLAWLGELYQLLQPLTETKRDDTEEPLSARRLTENMRRVKRAAKPLTNFRRDLTALSHWYSFYTSALAFLVFGYAVWHGWALSFLLFLGIVRLSLNYLIARGWRIRWSIVPEVAEAEEPMKMDLTMSEKFQLVLDVAQKAQNLFGKLADILEKLKNLLMWIEEDATQTLYLMFWAAFLASCFLPAPLLGRIMGLIIAFRFFVVAPVFNRFPRVRLRYDTAHRLWHLLPTNQQLRDRPPSLNSSRRNLGTMARSGSSPVLGGSDRGDDAMGAVPLSRKASFHETFSLPETEKPLPACENGWRCCLINRDKKISTDYIRNGLLYVTDNFICFESKSGPSKKNKVIQLQDITEIQKYKVLTMLPGSGMGISIKTPFTQKPLVFGAMVHRDEAYQTIMSRFSSLAQQPVQAAPEAANLNITACS
uniref:GRAM domain-containing protein 4 isoform X2 n=1 Tax=Myxine glutinosa TaxID=7769 RepID=UPI00358F46DD